MGRLSNLREAIFGAPKKTTIDEGALVISSTAQAIGIRTSTSFANQLKVFNEDPVIKESILQSAYQIVSTGFFTTYNEKYTFDLPRSATDPARRTAKDVIDEWCKLNDLDSKLSQIAIEMIAFGNSFWNITANGFTNIPIESIQNATVADKSIPIREKYNLQLTATYKSELLEDGEFLHFHTEAIGNSPMGAGIILGLIAIPADVDGVAIPSLYDIRKSTRASMKEGFKKFSFGNELWIFEGYPTGAPKDGGKPATGIYALGDSLRDMASTGKRIATNVAGDIKLALPQRTQSYDRWIEQIDNEFLMALGNPSLKLGLEKGFTKATAEAATDLYEMKLAAIKRAIKRLIESVWAKVLDKSGFDGKEADMRLNFGTQEIEYVTSDLFAAVDKRIIAPEEARHILLKNMKWDIAEEMPTLPNPPVADVNKVALETANIKIAALKLSNETARKQLYERLLKQ